MLGPYPPCRWVRLRCPLAGVQTLLAPSLWVRCSFFPFCLLCLLLCLPSLPGIDQKGRYSKPERKCSFPAPFCFCFARTPSLFKPTCFGIALRQDRNGRTVPNQCQDPAFCYWHKGGKSPNNTSYAVILLLHERKRRRIALIITLYDRCYGTFLFEHCFRFSHFYLYTQALWASPAHGERSPAVSSGRALWTVGAEWTREMKRGPFCYQNTPKHP